MQDLCKMNVTAKHTVDKIQANQTKPTQIVTQSLDLTDAALNLNLYIQDSIKDLISTDEYDKIFKIAQGIYQGNTNNIGYLTLQLDRYNLRQACLQKIKLKNQTYSVTFQKPTNDLELFEWLKGFGSNSTIKNLTTEVEDFSTGFCMVNDVYMQDEMPFNATDRKKWIKNIIPLAKNSHLKDLYVFVPMGEGAQMITEDQLNIHFVPTSKHNLDEVSKRVGDNKQLFKQTYQQSNAEDLGPVNIQDIIVDGNYNIDSQYFLKNSLQSVSGSDQINLSSVAEKMAANVIERVNLSLVNIDHSAMIKSSEFTFSQLTYL